MQSQPSVTINSLREQLGINKSAVQRLLTSLKEKGYIVACDNEGGWRVLITPSVAFPITYLYFIVYFIVSIRAELIGKTTVNNRKLVGKITTII